MSLKTPESTLRKLGLGKYSIIYDDDETEPTCIAFLYFNGVEIGRWDNDLNYVTSRPSATDLETLTNVLKELR